MVKHYIIAGIIGAVITFVSLRGCQETPKPQPVTETRIDTLFENVYVPVVQGEAKATKFTYGGMVHDTVTERIYITTERGDTIPEFTAILDTIQSADTLHLEYTYPSSMFKYSLSRAPIEYRYTNTVTTKTITLEPSKFSWGLQAGFGYLVSFRTGQSAIGAYFGIGGNYRL